MVLGMVVVSLAWSWPLALMTDGLLTLLCSMSKAVGRMEGSNNKERLVLCIVGVAAYSAAHYIT